MHINIDTCNSIIDTVLWEGTYGRDEVAIMNKRTRVSLTMLVNCELVVER